MNSKESRALVMLQILSCKKRFRFFMFSPSMRRIQEMLLLWSRQEVLVMGTRVTSREMGRNGCIQCVCWKSIQLDLVTCCVGEQGGESTGVSRILNGATWLWGRHLAERQAGRGTVLRAKSLVLGVLNLGMSGVRVK